MTSNPAAGQSTEDASYRLPRTIVPERYELRLSPDLDAANFTGEAIITITVLEPVQSIVLNAAELHIGHATLVTATGERLAGSILLNEADERATITFPRRLATGKYELNLTFQGYLNAKLRGFYRSTFRDQNGTEQVIAATQFESTDARRAFPCWDEPDFKAAFAVTLIVDSGMMAISNGPVESSELIGNGKKAVTFRETMKMSTYLVAFVVGPFEATDTVNVLGVPLRVITPRGKYRLGKYALGIGEFALGYFSNYFGIPYPAAKLDLIAIPDFAFGAMENLGAITFRETALLVDETQASQGDLERIADVVAHEIAHMWFGDLVTMRWWNGIWLNEAFATFMEMAAVDSWKPEWKRWDGFAIERSVAMNVDGLKSTRPVEYPVRRPEEATDMFDVLTYQKGGSVLRMLEQYLGPGVFRAGISRYLKEHQYANTETTDLWDAIEAASSEPVRQIMDSWILQAGFPLISVSKSDTGITLSQSIFRYSGSSGVDRLWQVPVLLRVDSENGSQQMRVLLAEQSTNVELPANYHRVVVNAGGSGFYRVRYSPSLLQMLGKDTASALSAVERYQLVDNTIAAMIAGLNTPADFLNLAQSLQLDTDRNVWAAIISGLAYLNRAVDEQHRPSFRRHARTLLEPIVTKVGWDPSPAETGLDRQLRAQVLGAMVILGDDAATQLVAQERYQAYLNDRSTLDPNLVSTVIEAVAHTGGRPEYEAFIERYRTASTPQEETRYLMALPVFHHRTLITETLEKTLNGEIRSQNAAFIISRCLANLTCGDVAWGYVKSHWNRLVDHLPANSISRMVDGLGLVFDQAAHEDAKAFFATAAIKEGRKQIEQMLERQGNGVAFKEREAKALAEMFSI